MMVTAVIVTYGNRYSFVEEVVRNLAFEGIDAIVIVLNDVEREVAEKIKRLKEINSIIFLVELDENTGSAGGFHLGIKKAIELKTDYIWLFDDDNCPQSKALDNMLLYREKRSFNKTTDALLSFRRDRPIYRKAVELNNGSKMLKGFNSSLGFSVFPNNHQYSNYRNEGLRVAPYGGLFFHKDLIQNIGLPDSSLFLYADDYDFTIRIPKKGGRILLVVDSEIQDLETSFHLQKKNGIQTRFHKTENLQLIYFSVRNAIIFELKYQVKNLIVYFINLAIYLALITFLLLVSLDIQKIKYFFGGALKGIKLGLRKRKDENKSQNN